MIKYQNFKYENICIHIFVYLTGTITTSFEAALRCLNPVELDSVCS